ncbi:MAG TPA: hypothetical protein VGH87_12700 [Polyangiaceae bacterium]|jgi:hypothetical protein
MNLRVLFFATVVACGNQEQPKTATPAASETATAATASAVASDAPSASAVASVSAAPTETAPPAPTFTKPLKDLLADAKTLKLTWREKLDSPDAKVQTITAASMKGIVDAIGADQVPSGGGPAYMATYSFRFEDAKGNPIATISLYSSATMSDSNKKYGRIDTADGKYAGITVATYETLQKKLKALSIPLP